MVDPNFSFNIQVFAEPLDHPAPPERRAIKVRLIELPVTNSSKSEFFELGRVDDLTQAALEQIGDALRESLRAQVRRTIEGLALQIRSPGMAAIIDKVMEQWTPLGVPKDFYKWPLGKPHEEPKPPKFCSVCGFPQFDTPGGLNCVNGHGGAPSKETK